MAIAKNPITAKIVRCGIHAESNETIQKYTNWSILLARVIHARCERTNRYTSRQRERLGRKAVYGKCCSQHLKYALRRYLDTLAGFFLQSQCSSILRSGSRTMRAMVLLMISHCLRNRVQGTHHKIYNPSTFRRRPTAINHNTHTHTHKLSAI